MNKHTDNNVLFTSLHGSRAYGLHTDSSDYDYRFVFVNPLTLFETSDYSEYSVNEQENYTGYSLKKFMLLLAKGNNQPYEWVKASDNCPEYFRQFVYEQTANKMSSFFMCYYGMVHNDFKEYNTFFGNQEKQKRNLKNILTMVRSFATMYHINKYKTLPSLNFNELYSELKKDNVFSKELFFVVDECLLKKRLDNYQDVDYNIKELKYLADNLLENTDLPNNLPNQELFEKMFKKVLDN